MHDRFAVLNPTRPARLLSADRTRNGQPARDVAWRAQIDRVQPATKTTRHDPSRVAPGRATSELAPTTHRLNPDGKPLDDYIVMLWNTLNLATEVDRRVADLLRINVIHRE